MERPGSITDDGQLADSALRRRSTRRQTVGHALVAALGATLARRGGVEAARSPASPAAADSTYPRSELLIEPAALRDRAVIPSRNPRTSSSRPAANLVTVALTTADEHIAARLPGASQIDWPALEIVDTSDTSLARWRVELERIVAGLGITPDHEVVAYDPGTLFAARLWWVLSYLGHDRVSLLHGGLNAWSAAGGEVASGQPTAAVEPAIAPYPSTPRDAMLAQGAEVQSLIGQPAVALVDARSPEEYVAGHIPGAVNFNYLGNVEAGPPPRWLSAAELRAAYAALGVTPDKMIIPYCKSGVRSAVTFFTLRLLGFPNVALFTGSWQEWETLPNAPVTTGDQP